MNGINHSNQVVNVKLKSSLIKDFFLNLWIGMVGENVCVFSAVSVVTDDFL